MRDTEFRGKEIETGKWAFGSLLIREEKSPVPETTETYKRYFIVNGGFENYEYEVIPETVGQYTGLKDKNGVKIFEGDIVKYKDYMYNHDDNQIFIGLVVWQSVSAGFVVMRRRIVMNASSIIFRR